jgi:isopenicillin N synthase-like dioxygenase
MSSRSILAVDHICARGFAEIQLHQDEREQLRAILLEGANFFHQSAEAKSACVSPDRNSGFRTIGEEYSQDPSRPDLNESYSIWGDNEPSSGRADSQLSRQMLRWQQLLSPFVTDLIMELRSRTVPDAIEDPVLFSNSSYAQLNYYFSEAPGVQREFLQDAHEDGHLVTLLVTDGPGLEVAVDLGEQFQLVTPDTDHLIVMPGSALTAISSGYIKPLYHRVRNHRLRERFSLMYFVNPDLSSPVYAWTDVTKAHDLGPAIANKPKDFGLPSVPR